MSLFITKSAGIFTPQHVRTVYNRCRIGNRDWVGFGHNGSANYKDDAHFPFPAVRFKENTRDIWALREKEKGDWRCLCCEEKKALYRSSFCQTFAEFQHPTGQWKLVLGGTLIGLSFALWSMMYYHYYVAEPLPPSLSKESQKAQLRRMLELRVNPIDGISSKWDYDNDRWLPGQEPWPSSISNKSVTVDTKADANAKDAPTGAGGAGRRWSVTEGAHIYAALGYCGTQYSLLYNMKCAVAIVLALIGMVVANPVASLGYGHGYGYGSSLLLPSAVSVSSSVVNHGLTIPKLHVAPIITAPIIKTVPIIRTAPIVTAPISLGWGGYGLGYGGWGGYGLGGHGGYGLGGHGGYSLGGYGGYGLAGYGGYGLGGWGGYGLGKGWH